MQFLLCLLMLLVCGCSCSIKSRSVPVPADYGAADAGVAAAPTATDRGTAAPTSADLGVAVRGKPDLQRETRVFTYRGCEYGVRQTFGLGVDVLHVGPVKHHVLPGCPTLSELIKHD